jgi:MYXO-CTERM domain-containing protein
MKSMSGSTLRKLLPVGALALAAVLAPKPAQACGGFFCSATNPVNQAAERIIFAKNNDSTVTAIIEIQYQGPSTSFSWLLPISSVPMGDQIAVASNVAFQRLQQATNPQYNLTLRVEGTCDQRDTKGVVQGSGGPTSANGAGPLLAEDSGGNGVTVEASGIVGKFEWTVISLNPDLIDPAEAAVTWLKDNGYDVPEGAPGLLGPYLQDGLNLLALRLQKGASVGSIRPIVLTYDAAKPMIPIKLTAVAANDDMGVMTWLLGDSRAVPQNYNALELNEARINWFSASTNYNQVVTEAANDAGGQGFVTEQAGPTSALANGIWSAGDEQQWQYLQGLGESAANVYSQAVGLYAQFDGFWDVVADHATLPAGITIDKLKQCPYCNQNVAVDAGFLAALETDVVQPVKLVQDLIDAHPQITRLYTTMSASEMTVDPLFSFNADLEAVNNIHTAERVIECGPGYFQDEAPWRIELPHGGVIRGTPSDVGSWPTSFASQPPNRLIMRQGESGPGQVLEDNSDEITTDIANYSAGVKTPPKHDTSSAGAFGCSTSGKPGSGSWAVAALGLAALFGRRRRR